MHITDLVTLIDHTTATTLLEFADNFKRTGRGIATIVGLDKMRARSHAEASMRTSAPIRAQERAEALTMLARVSLTFVNPAVDPITYLERISLKHVGPIAGQDDHPIRVAAIRAGKDVTRRFRAVGSSFRTALVHEERFTTADRDLSWTSLSRTERGTEAPTEMEKLSLASGEHPRLDAREWICVAEVAPTVDGDAHPFSAALAHGGKFLARMRCAFFQSLRGVLVGKEDFATSDHDMTWTSLSRIDKVNTPNEMDKLSLSSGEHPRLDLGKVNANCGRFM